MEIKEQYVRRYWYQMVEDQVYDEYKEKGYEVEKEYRFQSDRGVMCADLFATKGDEKIILEIVSRNRPKEHIMRLYSIAREMGAELRIVYANYSPLSGQNGFDGFNHRLEDYLNDINPGEFGEFATHSRVEEIEDVEFSGMYIKGLKAELSGECTIALATWIENDDPEYTYYVPCRFIVQMEYDKEGWFVAGHQKMEIDTSQLD